MATVDTSRSPSLVEFVTNAVESYARDEYHAGPAMVTAVNGQTVTVQPQIKKPAINPNGSQVTEARPYIYNVPVVWPSGGRFRISFPVAVGDTGLLVYCDQSLDIWKSGGGIVDPADFRLNDINDAVFIPGLNPSNASWTNPSATTIQIGKDGSPADFAVLAAKLVAKFNAHTHPAPGGTTSPPTTPLITSDVGSGTVQILG